MGEPWGRTRNAIRHHTEPPTAIESQQFSRSKQSPGEPAAGSTALAWQNTAYNQPPHTGFFIGDGMPTPPRPAVYTP
ncbi:hypothetical protein ABZT29_15240 [Streptomyces prasinus]